MHALRSKMIENSVLGWRKVILDYRAWDFWETIVDGTDRGINQLSRVINRWFWYAFVLQLSSFVGKSETKPRSVHEESKRYTGNCMGSEPQRTRNLQNFRNSFDLLYGLVFKNGEYSSLFSFQGLSYLLIFVNHPPRFRQVCQESQRFKIYCPSTITATSICSHYHCTSSVGTEKNINWLIPKL